MNKQPPPAPGIYPNTPMEVYQSWDCWNHSALSKFSLSAMHGNAARDGEYDDPTADMELGSAIHVWVLERENYDAKVARRPKFTGEGSRAVAADWESKHAGKHIIPNDRHADVVAVGEAIRRNEQCRRLAMNKGHVETCLVWKDERTGLLLKGRCDKWYPDYGLFLDLKSTKDASESKFTRSIVDYWYWTQAQMYREGFAALGYKDQRGLILAVEKEAPYGVAIYGLDHWRELAAKQLRLWLAQAAECEAKKVWPGYVEGIVQTMPPNWLEKKYAFLEEVESGE